MSEQFEALDSKHQTLIESQHVLFVATAAADGRVNVSPRGMSSLVVRAPSEILWLNLTGSGNETAAHLLEHAHRLGRKAGRGRHSRLLGDPKHNEPRRIAHQNLNADRSWTIAPSYKGRS